MVMTDRAGTESVDAMNDFFLGVMRNVAASVTVVTASHQGRHHGLTVSAFSSVSLEPPLVLVCIDKQSTSLPAIQGSGGFTVNFLAAHAGPVAMHFASKDDDKFATVAHRAPTLGAAGPWLPDHAYAYFECETAEMIDAGDHDVVIGRVRYGERINLAEPLVYWDRAFVDLVRPEGLSG
jgi:flavin reductase (DIM6/NTAB) family NADH-FMN oxidoreductase RutF